MGAPHISDGTGRGSYLCESSLVPGQGKMKTTRTLSCFPVRVLVSDISCSELEHGSTSGLPGLTILYASECPIHQYGTVERERVKGIVCNLCQRDSPCRVTRRNFSDSIAESRFVLRFRVRYRLGNRNSQAPAHLSPPPFLPATQSHYQVKPNVSVRPLYYS